MSPPWVGVAVHSVGRCDGKIKIWNANETLGRIDVSAQGPRKREGGERERGGEKHFTLFHQELIPVQSSPPTFHSHPNIKGGETQPISIQQRISDR